MESYKLRIAVGLVLLVLVVGTLALWVTTSSTATPTVQATGELSDGTVTVEPGKYEVTLPFTIENVGVTEATYTVHLEPGQGQDISVIIKRTGQDSIQVEMAPRIEIR